MVPTRDAAPRPPDAASDARADQRLTIDATDATPPPGATLEVFGTRTLHRIDIKVEPQYLTPLEMDRDNRVPCTITFDGTTLPMSGIRKKGTNGSLRPLYEKTGFSIKFNELVKGQNLAGLSKLLLNNAFQDPTFLSEHLAYEMARRAGLPAPLTAHGIVTFNDRPFGLYVVREAINDDFLRRTYGPGFEDGNLYEGAQLADFVTDPGSMDLKDVEEGRSRADLVELSRVARGTPDAQWVTMMSGKIDLSEFITAMAFEWVVGDDDGYFFGINNQYLYHHPGLDRFTYLVSGMDRVLGSALDVPTTTKLPALSGWLTKKILQLPDTSAQYHAKVAEMIANLDAPALLARIDTAARAIRAFKPTDAATKADYASFEEHLARVKNAIMVLARDGHLPR